MTLSTAGRRPAASALPASLTGTDTAPGSSSPGLTGSRTNSCCRRTGFVTSSLQGWTRIRRAGRDETANSDAPEFWRAAHENRTSNLNSQPLMWCNNQNSDSTYTFSVILGDGRYIKEVDTKILKQWAWHWSEAWQIIAVDSGGRHSINNHAFITSEPALSLGGGGGRGVQLATVL